MAHVQDEGKQGGGDTRTGFTHVLDATFVKATDSEVVLEMPISPAHHQPMGIVHGGVYCALVETACSVGANLAVQAAGLLVVGVDNHTSFLKAQRAGTLRTTARPLVRGKRTQLWEANVTNEQGELVATGRVRLICIEAGSNLAGQGAKMAP
jgi:uncharacterized protein (TIGR00369 family)